MKKKVSMLRKVSILFTGLLFACFLFTGCGEQTNKLTADIFPPLGGDGVAAVLARDIKAAILSCDKADVMPSIAFSDSRDAYQELSEGQIAVAFTVEEPPSLLQGKKTDFVSVPIAYDALVFYTPDSNPIKSLTEQELADLFMGKVTDWRSFSGEHQMIMPHLLPQNQFSHTVLIERLLGGKEPMPFIGNLVPDEEQDPLTFHVGGQQSQGTDGLLLGPGSISYGSFFLLEKGQKNLQIRLMSVSGVEPSTKTLTNGKYPFAYPIYAVIRESEPENSPARLLVDFLKGKEGQKVIKEAGYGTVS